MKLEITQLQVPGKIEFNYAELKKELAERLQVYSAVVYSEEQISEAKKDRADLNRLKKALNDERIRQEKEFMKPFDEFKTQVKELCSIIDKASATVDAQVKAFEDQQKADKFDAIKAIVVEIGFPVQIEKVMDQKWLNASVSLKSIKEALEAKKETILSEMQVIENLPAYAFEAKQFYLNTLDLAATMREVNRLQAQDEAKKRWFEQQEAAKKAKEEHEAEQVQEHAQEAEPEESVERQWIGFQALLSIEEAHALGAFLKSNGIKYKAL